MSIKEKQENANQSSFSISKYIVHAVLPKCIMIYGEAISSTFFQIALNVNHKAESPNWQKNKSWVSLKTISRITGFNYRTIDKAVKVLIDIEMLKQSYHGKLKTFQLLNNDINNTSELLNLLKRIEEKLVFGVDIEKRDLFRERFQELNKKINIDSQFHCQQLLKKIWIPDILSLRESLVKAELTYKGSSLFLINLMNQQLSFKKEKEESDNILSEKERSLMIGCSQSTLNRYVKAYEAANLIIRESQNGSYHIRINFNKSEPNQIKEGVVNSNMSYDKFICPICNRESANVKSFNLHLSKQSDAKHKFLNQLRRDKWTSIYAETMELYNQNKNVFDTIQDSDAEEVSFELSVNEQEVKQKTSQNYMSVPCECKISCEECFKDWKTDYFDGCKRQRKEAFVEEFNINEPEKKEQKQKRKQQDASGFENIPTVKKQPAEDTAPGLLKFFYDLNGKRSPNWGKESRQIKNLLTNKEQPLSPEQVRIVLRYMSRRGYDDIRFLSSSINDALLEDEYLKQIDVEGTVPYLLKYFYNGHGMELNLQTLTREVRKIQETINSGLSYEDTKYVIDYMIETGCTIINFIGSKRNDALSKKSGFNNVKTNSKDVNNFKNNPSFFDQDFANIIRDELVSGRANLRKIEESQKETAKVVARQVFMERKFTNRYTSFEWVWRTGLELDNEMYSLACKELSKTTYFDTLINSGKLNEEQLNTYTKLKNKFEAWLQQQHDFFQNNQCISNNS